MSKEIIAAQNRAEELLLKCIYDHVLLTKPRSPDELSEPATEHYKGYYEGWWDAVEMLGDLISENEEINKQKLKEWTE